MEKVLLVAGGGTLGTHVTEDLVTRGICVDVICLEDYKSNQMVTYYKKEVNLEYIKEFINGKKYLTSGNINYVQFEAGIDGIPLGKIKGAAGVITGKDKKEKIVVAVNKVEKYSQEVTNDYFGKIFN